MTTARRLHFNFALQHAVAQAVAMRKPLVILEALRCGYPHANARLHRFVLQGMAEHARALTRSNVFYYAFVEKPAGAGKGLLSALSRNACAVIADWYPAFFLPRMLGAAARQVDCAFEAVDTNGILPVAAAKRAVPRAHGFRAHNSMLRPTGSVMPPLITVPARPPASSFCNRRVRSPIVPI